MSDAPRYPDCSCGHSTDQHWAKSGFPPPVPDSGCYVCGCAGYYGMVSVPAESAILTTYCGLIGCLLREPHTMEAHR